MGNRSFQAYNRSLRLTLRDKRVLDFIFKQQDAGASIQKAAANIQIPYHHIRHTFNRLIKVGEIFRASKVYKSTAWAMQFDPKPIAERLREELERDLFGEITSPKIRAFLTEFHAGARMNFSVDESFILAQDKLLKPELGEVR